MFCLNMLKSSFFWLEIFTHPFFPSPSPTLRLWCFPWTRNRIWRCTRCPEPPDESSDLNSMCLRQVCSAEKKRKTKRRRVFARPFFVFDVLFIVCLVVFLFKPKVWWVEFGTQERWCLEGREDVQWVGETHRAESSLTFLRSEDYAFKAIPLRSRAGSVLLQIVFKGSLTCLRMLCAKDMSSVGKDTPTVCPQ